jgi:hypothetical protein
MTAPLALCWLLFLASAFATPALVVTVAWWSR